MAAREDQLLERINRFAWEVASQMHLPHVRRVAVARTRELTDADGATLFLLDPASGELSFDEVDGDGSDVLVNQRLPAGQGIAGRVALEREAVLVGDVGSSRDFHGEFDHRSGFATGSVIAVPLSFGPELLGVLEAVRREGAPALGTAELELMLRLAPHVAAAVKHAQTEDRLRRARESLERSNEQLEARVQERTAIISQGKREWEATFDAIQDPSVVLEGMTVRRANRAWQRAAGGLPWSEIIGLPCHQVLARRATPCQGCPLLLNARVSEVRVGESSFEASTWAMRPAAGGAGGPTTTVLHYRDVTEQRSLVTRLNETERLAAVGQLAAGAAHEINNPLAIVMSHLGLVRDLIAAGAGASATTATMEAGAVREAAELIGEALAGGRRIGEVVKSLRELSRYELGQAKPSDLNQAVQRAVRRVLGDAQQGAALSLEANEKVAVAPNQLEQAIENVVRNARQAGTGHVWLRTWDDEVSTFLEVRDDGCGIPPEHLPRVFEPFFTTRPVGDGRGLGLAVTWSIVKRHGGDVSLESQVGRGTTITLRFPRAGSLAHQSLTPVPRARGVHG